MASALRAEQATTLRVRLLGGVDLRFGEERLPPLESARAESLLAYLLLHADAPRSRQHLAFLLWPDSTESQARTNLRHVLHTLRRALPDPDRFLDVTPRTLQWRTDAAVWLDVAAFEEAVARAERASADGGLAALRDAVELYAADLMEGCYDEWILDERARLRQRLLDVLARLVALLEANGDHAQAILHAERLLRADPLHEETHRLLMRLHDARGDRARALRVYHAGAAALERELGVEPAAATRAAYDALLSRPPHASNAERQANRLGGPPLVGRMSERARLTSLWRATEGGRTQVVLVAGEAGIGKSRLVEEFRDWCAHHGAMTAEARSYPAEGALAYGPVVAWLRSEALKPRLRRLDRARLAELARLLPELLVDIPGLAGPEPLPEDEQRQRLFDAVADAMLASGGPLLLVADDLHWCDRETLRLLHYLLRVEPNARLLLAATARREEIDLNPPLTDFLAGAHALDRCTEIDLERLTQAETAALAERITGRPTAAPAANRLHTETEGNPLFVVETLRAGWTDGPIGTGRLSPKVQAAIEARLGQLSAPARELVGLAATIGREFTADVLADASEAPDETLVQGLDELWRRRIVREQGADAYDFSHDKIREVAYLGLNPARRRHNHLRVARALERLAAHEPDPVSGQLAAHFERAGAVDQAVTWYGRAAAAAQRLHANTEAIRLLERALDLLQRLPPTAARHARELALLTALPAPIAAVEGWAAARLATAQRRALDLAAALGIEPEPPLLRSLAFAGLARRDFAAARGFGDRLRVRGEHDADDVLVVEAACVLGIGAFFQGELETARAHFETAVDRYRAEHRGTHLLRYGLDPKVVCLSRLGNTLWFLGRPEAASQARDAALALVNEIGHPFSRGTALVFAMLLALEMRDHERMLGYGGMLTSDRGVHESRPVRVAAEGFGGYVDALAGRKDIGIARIQRALQDARDIDHAPGMRAILVRLLLETCVVAGDAEAGLAATERALAANDGVRLWEAETRRLRAGFLAALGASTEQVEAELERALAVALDQGAKMLELRAAVSMVRLRLDQDDDRLLQRARVRLSTIVANLPEARDTHDLREAVTLLGRR